MIRSLNPTSQWTMDVRKAIINAGSDMDIDKFLSVETDIKQPIDTLKQIKRNLKKVGFINVPSTYPFSYSNRADGNNFHIMFCYGSSPSIMIADFGD